MTYCVSNTLNVLHLRIGQCSLDEVRYYQLARCGND